MKNKIIILGLAGTGKTTLAKTLAEKTGYLYLNDWKIIENKNTNLLEEINSNLKSNARIIFDLDLRNFDEYVLFENNETQDAVYLLFDEFLDVETLFKVFQEKDKNITIETLKSYLEISKKYIAFCEANNLEFVKISKDRNEVLINLLNKLKV